MLCLLLPNVFSPRDLVSRPDCTTQNKWLILANKQGQLQLTRVKFDGVLDLARADVHHHCVIDLNQGIRVPDSTAVTCRHKRYPLWSNLLPSHTAKLVL